MADYGRYDDYGTGARDRYDSDYGRRSSANRDRTQGRDRSIFGAGWNDDGGYTSGNRTDRYSSNRYDRTGGYGYGSDDYRDGLAIEETSRLIASNKVEGTAVYGREGERLGSIYNFMVDKRSGRVDYAVMSWGGFLGLGARYYPLPWQILKYDQREGGYRVDIAAGDLERAPSFGRDDEPAFTRDYGERVYGWYGLQY